MTSDPSGIDCTDADTQPCSADFDDGTEVTLTAQPASGSEFGGWDGCSAGDDPLVCTVTVDAEANVTATFDIATVTLFVEFAGTGSGQVTSDPAGIDCTELSQSCSAEFDVDSEVVLTADAAGGSMFTGWGEGNCDSVSGDGTQCTLTMQDEWTVTASFDPMQHPLTIAVSGSGTVTSSPGEISCPPTCTWAFEEGTEVALFATPDEGSNFEGWSPNCAADGSTCSVTVDAPTTVGAFFAAEGDTLALAAAGPATVGVGGLIPFSLSVLNARGEGGDPVVGASIEVATTLLLKTQGCTEGTPDLWTCPLPSLAPGTRIFTVYAVAPATTTTVTVDFDLVPPSGLAGEDLTNNSASVMVDVEGDLLALTVTSAPESATGGTLLTYSLDLRNVSASVTATTLTLHVGVDDAGVTLPDGASCTLDGSPATGYERSFTCSLADLAFATVRALTFRAYAPDAATTSPVRAEFWVGYATSPADSPKGLLDNDIAGPAYTDVSPAPSGGFIETSQTFEAPSDAPTELTTLTASDLSADDPIATQVSLPGGFLGTVEVAETERTTVASIWLAPFRTLARPTSKTPTVPTCTATPKYEADCLEFGITIAPWLQTRFVYRFTFRYDESAFTDYSVVPSVALDIRTVGLFHDDGSGTFVLVPKCKGKPTEATYGGTAPCLLSKMIDPGTGDYIFVVLTPYNGNWVGGRSR